MKNWKIIIIIVIIFIFGGMIYKGQIEEKKENSAPIEQLSLDKEISDGTRELQVSGKNYEFNTSEIRVKKGEKIRIIFNNTQGLHDFRIEGYRGGTKQISEGSKDIVEFVADKTGTFEYFCSVGDHRQRGMKGKLVVE